MTIPEGASLPLRECGLKWSAALKMIQKSLVTPLAGVWIEIPGIGCHRIPVMSLPLRECGLKFPPPLLEYFDPCHSPCGSVD